MYANVMSTFKSSTSRNAQVVGSRPSSRRKGWEGVVLCLSRLCQVTSAISTIFERQIALNVSVPIASANCFLSKYNQKSPVGRGLVLQLVTKC